MQFMMSPTQVYAQQGALVYQDNSLESNMFWYVQPNPLQISQYFNH